MGALIGGRHHIGQLLLRFREDVQVVLLPFESLLRGLVLVHGNLNLSSVALDVLLVGLIDSRARHNAPLVLVLVSHLDIVVLLLLEILLAVVDHLGAVRAHAHKGFDGRLEVVDGALLLEVQDLVRDLIGDVARGSQLEVALGQLVLAEEDSFFLVLGLQVFVLLVNQILNLAPELTLHLPHLWRNHVAKGFVHRRDLGQCLLHGIVELHEVLLVGKLDLVVGGDWLEEHLLSLFGRHLAQAVSLLKLSLVVRLVIGRNLIDDTLTRLE